MLALIRQYDTQCLSAAERGGNLSELFAIPAREKDRPCQGVPADQYKDAYANLLVEMEEQLAAIAEKGREGRMIREYKTIREISGPLMVVDHVQGVTYDELAEIVLRRQHAPLQSARSERRPRGRAAF